MTANIDFIPSSVLGSFGSYIKSNPGAVFQAAPSITDIVWVNDGGTPPHRSLSLGNDGTSDFGYGTIRVDMPTIAALSSGQAIAWVRWKGFNSSTIQSGVRYYIECNNPLLSTVTRIYDTGVSPNSPTLGIAVPGGAVGADWRTYINQINMLLATDSTYTRPGGQVGALWSQNDMTFSYQVYDRPTLAVTGPTTGGTVTSTTRPTITWTFTGDSLTQGGFRVRVFTAAQYGAGGFNPETSTATYDSGVQASTNLSLTLPTSLLNTTVYRAYVMAYQALPTSLYPHWTVDGTTLATLGATQYTQFTINTAPPPVPTGIVPVNGGTVNTDLPTLGAQITPSATTGFKVKAAWQLARDSGFTTSVKNIYQPDSELGGVVGTPRWVYLDVPLASELFQGLWYARTYEIDEMGVLSSLSSTTTFTVSHPPSTTSHFPTGAVTQAWTPGALVQSFLNFTWLFSDTSPTDSQTAAQAIIERDSDGFQILDTGKVASTSQGGAAAIPIAYKDVLLRWRVKVWDSDDVAGSFSPNQQFVLRDIPSVTITAPTTTYDNPAPTLAWTFAASGGRTQSAYRVQLVGPGSVVVHESGWLNGANATYTVPTPVLTLGTVYTANIFVRDNVGLEGTAAQAATATWTPPTNPTYTVQNTGPGAYAFDTVGGSTITWPQNRDAAFISYRIYRRNSIGGTRILVGETTATTSTYTFVDYSAPANTTVYYEVVQVATRFGSPVEGVSTSGSVGLTPSTHYWLLDYVTPANNVRLSNVTADDFSEVYEQTTITLIGRGRRVERGTRYGYEGSITATVRDTSTQTARQIRQALETMKAGGVVLHLRQPFGDVWQVAVGDLAISRLAGVGVNEFFSVTIPYTEVAS